MAMVLACGVSASALLCAAEARAQDAPAEVQDAPADDTLATGEIVVTAQRRSESIQKVPISIQAFDSATLETAGSNGVEDLPMLTSGLTMTRTAGASTPYIRGIGSPTGNPGEESPVATYVDGVLRGSLNTTHLSFSDVERVEVLKGPQGTLFGRNTTGGLIQVVTKNPSETPMGEINFSVDNYHAVEVGAYGTTGLADGVAISLAGFARRQEKGYGINQLTGNSASHVNESSARTKLMFTSGGSRLILAADYSQTQDQRGFNRTPPPGAVGGVRGGTPAQTYTYVGNFHDVAHNVDDRVQSDSWGVSATYEQSIGKLNLISVTAYRNDFTDILTDNDYGKADLSRATFGFYVRNFTQEVRITSPDDARLTWIIGGFFLAGYAGNIVDIQSVPTNAFTRYRAQNRTKSYSVFGEVALKLFRDTGKITLGARYTVDRRRIGGLVNGAVVPVAPVNPRYAAEDPTYRIVYSHQLTPDVLAYASYNRGFKSGNFNIIPATTNAYKPEYVNAYEVGFKTTLFDRRVRFNLSAYYYDYSNIQVRVATGLVTATLNAASATIKGVDGEVNIRVAEGLTLDLVGAYTDGRYDSFRNAEIFVPNVAAGTTTRNGGNTLQSGYDASGKSLIRSPKFTGSAGISYVQEVSGGRITASMRGSYNSGFVWEPSGRLRQRPYGLLNASIGYRSDDGWSVTLSGNNITDTDYMLTSGAGTSSDFFAAANPATVTLGVGFQF
ncbi:TonB-dependent receptor [Sphingomonas sp. AOB5]|nr:TonB-dependent receptor [Sphingomonas sp. AOB5]